MARIKELEADAYQEFGLVGVEQVAYIGCTGVVRVANFGADAEEGYFEIEAGAHDEAMMGVDGEGDEWRG